MKARLRNNGSVLLIAIFATALLSAITIGILQINTEEIQLMRNQIRAAEALATTSTATARSKAVKLKSLWPRSLQEDGKSYQK